MGSVLLMTVPPIEYLDIKMMDKYANLGDAREKKLGVPKSLVGSGELDLFIFHCTRSLRFLFPPFNSPIPDCILVMCPFSLGSFVALPRCSRVSCRAGHIGCDV
jgi:hypothetical protein